VNPAQPPPYSSGPPGPPHQVRIHLKSYNSQWYPLNLSLSKNDKDILVLLSKY